MHSNFAIAVVLRRVVERAALGVWRQRGGVLLAALVAGSLAGYALVAGSGETSTALAQGAPSASGGDCASTVMAAIESPSAAVDQQAYQCMAPAYQQSVSEPGFVQQLAALQVPNVTAIHRLGSYATPAGGTLVYFAVDARAGSAGYVVSLGSDGKVLQIS
jgi:hypothetical protein